MTREQLNKKYPWLAGRAMNKHHNGGGWVESTAKVSDTAYVGPDAVVYDTAQVCGSARVYDTAQVCGSARVRGSAQVYGSAVVKTRCMTIGPIGSREAFTTYCPDSDTVCCGCFVGTIDEFEAKVKSTHGDNSHARDYMTAIGLFRAIKI